MKLNNGSGVWCFIRFPVKYVVVVLGVGLSFLASAAVVPDRTRVIFNEGSPFVSVMITNKNPELPFVVQSWIEDEHGKKIVSPFMVLPPLQRVEANENSALRIIKIPESVLSKTQESVFYLNIREIPPKSQAVNSMQIALQSKIKLFYRPAGVTAERGVDRGLSLNVAIDSAAKKLMVDNPTPFHITIVGLLMGAGKESIPVDTIMLSPMAKTSFDIPRSDFNMLSVSHMNDYGGQTDSEFKCVGGLCKGVSP